MKTLTIKQKQSGTGSIHDIKSEHVDRKIKFSRGCKYAVVIAAFYGGKGYSTHQTLAAAQAKSRSLGDFSHQIIDCDGEYCY